VGKFLSNLREGESRIKRNLFCACLLITVFLITGNAQAWVEHVEKLASAEPDECYNGPGERVDPIGGDPFTCPDTEDPQHPEYAIPYTPQAYVWSLTQYENSLWFGTGANVLCTTQGAFFSEVGVDSSGSSICEFGESPVFDPENAPNYFPNLPDLYGDWRPPKIYQYDLTTGTLIDRTPYTDPNLYQCLGLRSAGSHDGVVIFAGGSFDQGIVMFAYDATNGNYLGSRPFPLYRTGRKWKVIKGQLYTGVSYKVIAPYWGSGRVLKWTGFLDADPIPDEVLKFDEVGNFPNLNQNLEPVYGGLPRELTEYIDGAGQSRIAVTANGVWLSPPIPPGGLTIGDAGSWLPIWTPELYEPDYVTRQTYVGGGIEYLNGWLYFMTMHIPGNAADVHENCYQAPLENNPFPSEYCFGPTENIFERLAVSTATARATTLWRIKNAANPATREIQLLYGEAELPQYQDGIHAFSTVDNLGNYTPILGSSGFNNEYNNYGWVMQVAGNYLFAGTMDYYTLSNPGSISRGADLWRIPGTAGDTPLAAVPETTNAFKDFNNPGNPDIYQYSPYGFRNLIRSADGTKLFAGMATGVNVGAVGDGAGWQLLQLDLAADPPPFCPWDIDPEGSNDFDVDGLDLVTAAETGLAPARLQEFALQFGNPTCQ